MVEPTAKRSVADYFISHYQMSERQACRLLSLAISSKRYVRKVKEDDEYLKAKLKELATVKPRYGYRRLGACLKDVNHKKVYRLYKEINLSLACKKSKRLTHQGIKCLTSSTFVNEHWSMDFISDRLTDGRHYRCLNIIDDYSRFNIAISPAFSLPSLCVTKILDQAINMYGKPQFIRTDNGPEFRSNVFTKWAVDLGINLKFIEPGKPTQNAYVESFNGKFRDECLDQHWFHSMQEAQTVIKEWRHDYNHIRPHSALNYLSPVDFVQTKLKQKKTV